jgi:hypothetical protein
MEIWFSIKMYVSIYFFGCKTRIWSIPDVIYMIEIAMNIILNCLYFKHKLGNKCFLGFHSFKQTHSYLQFETVWLYTY